MSFEEFQDDGHLGHRNGTILAILNLCHCYASYQVSAQAQEEMLFEEFHGGHLEYRIGYRIGTILATLNLHVATMPPTKLQLNPTWF